MKPLDQSAQTNWKFIGIVAFVAVFLAGGILLLIPQFQDQTLPLPQQNTSQIDTSNWQTYRNDEFGFEVKYPADTFAVVPVNGNFGGYGGIAGEGSKLIFAGRNAKLGKEECAYGETDRATTCRAEYEDGIAFVVLPGRFADFQAQFTGYDAYREETVGGRKGFYWGIDFEHTYRRAHYYVALEEGKTLYIQIVATGTYQGNEIGYTYLPSKEMVDQILSTFRFVE